MNVLELIENKYKSGQEITLDNVNWRKYLEILQKNDRLSNESLIDYKKAANGQSALPYKDSLVILA